MLRIRKNMNLGSVTNKQLAIKLELLETDTAMWVGLNISVEMIATGSCSAPREVSS